MTEHAVATIKVSVFGDAADTRSGHLMYQSVRGSDSYKPRNVTHIWQVAGCEFQDLAVLKTQSVLCSLLSIGDGKSHLNVIGVGSGAGKNTQYAGHFHCWTYLVSCDIVNR